MSQRNRYYLGIDDLARARGPEPALAFDGNSPAALAAAVQDALRNSALFERWRARQDAPDEIDPALGRTDPLATVQARQDDLHVAMEIVTELPMPLVQQRLNWLIGVHWTLRDVRTA